MTNCCNDYGQCTQGDNCPIRSTYCQPEPEQQTEHPICQIHFWLTVFLVCTASIAVSVFLILNIPG